MTSGTSVHSAGINEIHQVPINVINRPIPPVLEEEKVKSLMKTIQVSVFCLFFLIKLSPQIDSDLSSRPK